MKYLITYNQLNEGLRDKMLPVSDKEIIKSLKDEYRHVKLEKGIEYGILELVKMGVDEGADINAFPAYIRDAVKSGNLELVKFLLDNDIKIWEGVAPHPTIVAIREKDVEMLKLLKEYGLDVGANSTTFHFFEEYILDDSISSEKVMNYLINTYDFVKNNYLDFEIKETERKIKELGDKLKKLKKYKI